MSEVQVIGLPQSNFVWAVRIALAEKGVPHESIAAAPHSPEVAAMHPFGKIPVLRHGDVVIGESRAIIDYVDAMFDGPPLVPAELKARIDNGVWTSIVTSTIEPLLVRQFLFAHLFPATPDGQPDGALISGLVPKVEATLDVLERAIASGAVGSAPFGRPDAYLVPILFYLGTTPEGQRMVEDRPHVSAYLDRNMARPSVKATLPHREAVEAPGEPLPA